MTELTDVDVVLRAKAVLNASAPAIRHVSYDEVAGAAYMLAERWRPERANLEAVYGVPRGGCVPATMVGFALDLPMADVVLSPPTTLIVDDLVDSGSTLGHWCEAGYRVDALFRKSWSPSEIAPLAEHLGDDWLSFPWEAEDEQGPEDNVRRLLQFLGEDPTRSGLLDTPKRVVKAMQEMTQGNRVDIAALLARVFEDTCDEMVVVRNIEFTSLCEHHLLPFTGCATVAYVPGDNVVGLSKLARLVDAFAMRLQVQERMTQQIAQAIDEHLSPRGVGVVVRAHHSCMGCRGVKKPGAEMVTSALSGLMKDDPKARAEFMALADGR